MDDRYFTAAEAAEALGVSISTLYVYVGRKGIRSQSVPGSKQRRYWRPDIERLRKNGASLPQASLDLKIDSELTLLTEDDVFYRGRSAIALSETASFETVAALLWNAEETQVFSQQPPNTPALFHTLDEVMSQQPDVDRATAIFPLLEAADPRSYDLSPAGMARTGADVLRWLATLTVQAKEPCCEPIHLFLARHLGKQAVSNGRHGRLAGHDATHRFLREIFESADPERPVLQRLRDGEQLPGFDPPVYRHGEPIYRNGDPRARAHLRHCSEVLADDEGFKRLKRALAIVREARNLEPNNALVCLFIFRHLGLEPDSTLFQLSRAAGWIGHAIEQHQAGEIQHRRGLYSGPLPA